MPVDSTLSKLLRLYAAPLVDACRKDTTTVTRMHVCVGHNQLVGERCKTTAALRYVCITINSSYTTTLQSSQPETLERWRDLKLCVCFALRRLRTTCTRSAPNLDGVLNPLRV